MGLLDQLWDDTVAGPRPESGLGKLRKQQTFSFRSSSGKESDGGNMRLYGDNTSEEPATRVTRSIMIVKPPGYQSGSPPVSPAGTTPPVSPFSSRFASYHSGSPPVSPAGSTPPVSPFSGGREPFRFRRKSTSDAYEKASQTGPRSTSPPYDV
ncbi:Dormancy/auxin associated family protein [Quillaja saponaria]|uniref:Dormancy/auxin associated family protein n=1 Tax=Quillaja saponaria TaxID=32244 RepID=A0AAD7QAG7_QUISA|nr:Dormancy/auxin associated family protein [Quillaja saponaria]